MPDLRRISLSVNVNSLSVSARIRTNLDLNVYIYKYMFYIDKYYILHDTPTFFDRPWLAVRAKSIALPIPPVSLKYRVPAEVIGPGLRVCINRKQSLTSHRVLLSFSSGPEIVFFMR